MSENDVLIELDVLKKQMEANRWLTMGLAVSLVQNKKISAEELLTSLMLATVYLKCIHSEVASDFLLNTVNQLEPIILCEGNITPHAVMATMTSLLVDAGPGRADALSQWITSATQDEIAEDINALFQKIAKEMKPDQE